MDEKITKIQLGAAKCALDITDGSERGEYVSQDYIINKLGRPHRSVNLMYCYYPLDEGFPGRASVVHAHDDVSFAWDYPYDDYFTYKGGLGGNTEGEPFEYMRDIRRHGQDVTLTLTIDPHVTDEHLIAVANDLKTFGRMFCRVNHEATGNWFSFNKRCTYQEVADFFVRVTRIFHEHAPNVKLILCIGGIEQKDAVEIEKEKEFAQAVCETDIWSVDKYPALHWGWPYDIAERGGHSHARHKISDMFYLTKRSYERFTELNGGKGKPMTLGEMNVDGDVTGPYDQAQMVKELYDTVKNENATWLSSITFYQFRDRGRLGLEIEDPSNANCGFEQPELAVYKEIMKDEYFSPTVTDMGEIALPATLRWGGAEDAEGLAINVHFDKNPTFCEVYFEENLNLMLEINGKWFYKSPECKFVDLMPAFFEKPIDTECDMTLKIFAPPASGENDLSIEGGNLNTYTTITKMPNIRVRFEPTEL